MRPDKGLSWCPQCEAAIRGYNRAVTRGDRAASRDALDVYLDHRRDDLRHRAGGDLAAERRMVALRGVAACRAVLAATPNRAFA